MNTRPIALAGAALLLLGAFAPVVSLPIVGNVTLLQDGRSAGWIWIGIAIAAAYFATKDDDNAVGLIGKGGLILAVAWLFYTLIKLSDVRAEASKSLEGNPFKGFADAAMGTIQLQWGWAALFVGASMLIYAGSFSEKKFACPKCKAQIWEGEEDCATCGSYLRWIGERAFLRPRPTSADAKQLPQPASSSDA